MSEEETNKEETKEQELGEADGYAPNAESEDAEEILPWYRRLPRWWKEYRWIFQVVGTVLGCWAVALITPLILFLVL
jgi:hypothetical protein